MGDLGGGNWKGGEGERGGEGYQKTRGRRKVFLSRLDDR